MNISALKRSFMRGSRTLTVALKRTCRPSPDRTAMRLLARAEREERRIRERIELVKSWRARAKALMGSRTNVRSPSQPWPSPVATKGEA